jgi:hypothetical protein
MNPENTPAILESKTARKSKTAKELSAVFSEEQVMETVDCRLLL